jgi:phytoene synthase
MDTMKDEFLAMVDKINMQDITKHPNILVAAHFWEPERYEAARTCYRFLRTIDDMIDDHKSIFGEIDRETGVEFQARIFNQISSIKSAENDSGIEKELFEVIRRFRIPLWPFEVFARSMIFDINHDGFSTFREFMGYAQGASVAPASIFVHLCGLRHNRDQFDLPSFDVRNAATPCAIFSYIVHIIRDFQADQLNHLNYFADDLLLKYGLDKTDLRSMAELGRVNDNFRCLITEYYSIAEDYKDKTRSVIRELWPSLPPRYQLSLLIIFNLYLMVFERIDPKNGQFTRRELEPDPDEIRDRVLRTIYNFNSAQPVLDMPVFSMA